MTLKTSFYALHNYRGDFLIFCNFKKGDTSLSNCFIHEVCDTKASLSFSIPQRDFATQLVLNNNCIKINKQVAYFDVLKQNRVFKVSHLFFSREGGILSYQNFVDKHAVIETFLPPIIMALLWQSCLMESKFR